MLTIYYGFFAGHHFLRVEEWQLTSQLPEESLFGMPGTRKSYFSLRLDLQITYSFHFINFEVASVLVAADMIIDL